MWSPPDSLLVLGRANISCIVYGLIVTPEEFGAAHLTHRRPYGFWKVSRYPWNRESPIRLCTKMTKISVFTHDRRKPSERFVKAPLVQCTVY